jgi:hypothetical protein
VPAASPVVAEMAEVAKADRAFQASDPPASTAYIEADLRNTGQILDEAGQILGFSQPIAVLLLGILLFIPGADEPAVITARPMAAVPSGSYLASSHSASDIQVASVSEGNRRYNERSASPSTSAPGPR